MSEIHYVNEVYKLALVFQNIFKKFNRLIASEKTNVFLNSKKCKLPLKFFIKYIKSIYLIKNKILTNACECLVYKGILRFEYH